MLSFYLSMLQSKEEKAFVTRLYEDYEQILFAVSYSIMKNKNNAEDAVQETFLRVVKNIDKFLDKSCPKNGGYLVVIVRNVCFDMLKKASKEIPAEEISAGAAESAEDQYLDGVLSEELSFAVGRLPEKYLSVLQLSVQYGFSTSDIADILGIGYETARKRLYRAKEAVKANLSL